MDKHCLEAISKPGFSVEISRQRSAGQEREAEDQPAPFVNGIFDTHTQVCRGMDDLVLNRMLFEWLRDRWKEQAHLENLYLNDFKIINLTDCHFMDNFLFFLYDPLSRVLSAFGVIMRFKTRLSI
jgi:hypothetical protein